MKMIAKQLILAALLLVALACYSTAELILTAGDSFEFDFHTITLAPPIFPDPDPPIMAEFNLGSDLLNIGDSVIFSAFENSANEPATRTATFDGGDYAYRDLGMFIPDTMWQDKQGAFRIEVISGSVALASFTARVVIDGEQYGQIYAVPEPSSIALLFLGGGALYLRRKRFPTRS